MAGRRASASSGGSGTRNEATTRTTTGATRTAARATIARLARRVRRAARTRRRKAPATRAYLSLTFTRSAPVRPKTSGVYISSTLVGGSTKLPSEVARAR